MRRSPKALERERRIEAFIAEANKARDPTPDETLFRAVVEDPAFHSLAGAPGSVAKPKIVAKKLGPPIPEADARRIQKKHHDRMESLFRRSLCELFIAIVGAHVMGPVLPDDIELPDAPALQRLRFNSDGTGRVEGRGYRERFEELYGLLDLHLDLRRIRECSSCKKIFWARRSDQVGCQRDCANRIRVSRHYNKSKAQNAAG